MNKLRVWNIINIDREGMGKKSLHFPVETPDEGARLISALAKIELLVPDSVIGSNVFGMEELDGKAWCEWEDEDGNDIEFYVDQLEEE